MKILEKLSKKKALNVVGIMSGTSVDGIDFVLSQVKRSGKKVSIQFLSLEKCDFSPQLSAQLKDAAKNKLNVWELAHLHHELGREYSRNLLEIKKKKKWKFDVVGLHGQTVFHAPPHATFQIGEATYLSLDVGAPVVSNFRVADLALGGQGAPLASLFHQVAFFGKKDFALHNLGGISNMTAITTKGVQKAFDTGPANILMDAYIQKVSNGRFHFDENGSLALQGLANEKLVSELLEAEFFHKQPPKSCGREEFGEKYLASIISEMKGSSEADVMATLLELSARSIAESYKKFAPKTLKRIICCGGGAKNPALMNRLKYHLPDFVVETTEQHGWPVDAVEGGAFALLAAYKIWDMPSNLPKTTGAKRAVSLGQVTTF